MCFKLSKPVVGIAIDNDKIIIVGKYYTVDQAKNDIELLNKKRQHNQTYFAIQINNVTKYHLTSFGWVQAI